MKCQGLTIVARVGDYQYLACCEHGAVHLGWYYGAFHLRPDDFGRVVKLLEQSDAVPDWVELKGEGCCLIRQQNGCFQLWIGSTALFLRQAELLLLLELVQAALPSLDHVLARKGGELGAWFKPLTPFKVKWLNDGKFGLNWNDRFTP